MDVWEWIFDLSGELSEAGRIDVVRLVRALPEAALAGDVVRAEAMTVELVAQSRELRLPWLEVFARHWRMQASNADQRGAVSLGEATSVFEFAHREDSIRCPQSVCVVQDLCLTYGHTDGPGFARERIAVAEETLDRIDPTWACWSCLTTELVEGLVDAGRGAEAAAELDRRCAALLEVGERPSLSLEETRVTTLIDRGDLEGALATIADIAARDHPESDLERKHARLGLLQCEALARLGRGDEALRLLPDVEVVQHNALSRERWVTTIERLVALGVLPNDAELGALVHGVVEHARRGGAWRRMFLAAAAEARLAAGRGAGWVAADAVRAMSEARAELRVDAGADAVLADVRAGVAALPARPLPAPPAELLEHLASLETHDVEAEIEWLRLAAAAHPEDDDLIAVQAHLLGALGRDDLARPLLEARLAQRPDAETIAALLGELALRSGDAAVVEAVTDAMVERHPTTAWWILARQRAADGRWREVVDLCDQVAAVEPTALNTRRLWADAARHLGDHETAVALLTEVIGRSTGADVVAEGDGSGGEWPNPGDHWNRMVDATIIGRWDVVRESAAALELPIDPGTGTIDERWEQVIVEIDEAGGMSQGVAAIRTGPVTAVVQSISPTNDPQRVGDLVVFDPAPVEVPPDDADDETLQSFVFRYPYVATVSEGGFTGWFIDGFDPGPDQYWAFNGALADAGVRLWIHSSEDYCIFSPAGDQLAGIYGRIATPAGMSPTQADALLQQLTAAWAHPLSWIGLAEAAGADVSRHQQIIDAYGL